MEITIKKSSMIHPASHTPNHHLWCSPSDLHMQAFKYIYFVLFYKLNGSPPNLFQPQVLKEALSKVLVPFYPAAGRFGRDESGRMEIICNAEGVLFVEAEASVALNVTDHLVPSEKLAPPVDDTKSLSSCPIFLIQVTRFKCGGVSVAVKFHHTLFDGFSGFYFFTCWCDMVRGVSSSISPFIDRTIIKSIMRPAPASHHVEFHPPPPINMPRPSSTSTTTTTSAIPIKISKIQLNELRAKSNTTGENRNYNTYCILSAHLWRCLAKARGLPDNQETKSVIPVDARFRLKHPPLIPLNYFGNAIVGASITALTRDLLFEPFVKTVERIHEAITQFDDTYVRSAFAQLENLSIIDPDSSVCEEHTRSSPNLCVNDLSRLPLHKADFGWGAPVYLGGGNVPEMLYMVSCPTDDTDGGLVLIANLETSSLKLFQEELIKKSVSKL